MKGKKIVLVNQHTAYLFIDIANAFAEEYDEVVLMAGIIHPLGNELDPGIKVHKITPYNKKSTVTRLLSWFIGFLQVGWALAFKYRKHELFLYSNPPIIVFLRFLFRRKTSFLVVDVYPDALVSTGMLASKDSAIFRFWAGLNRKVFRKLHSLSTITRSMASRVEQYTDHEVEVVPLWMDNTMNNIVVDRDKNEFFKKYDLDPSKFYVVYSGNLGKGHSVETLVEVADRMKERTDISFIIAGEGYKEDMLRSGIESRKLTNIHLFPYQERDVFIHLLAATDLGVVTIDEPNAYVSIPSKTFNLLGASKPIICFGIVDSDLGILVNDNKAGRIFDPVDLENICRFIDSLSGKGDTYDEFAENSRICGARHSSENARQFLQLHLSN